MADPSVTNPFPNSSRVKFLNKLVTNYRSPETITIEQMIEYCPTSKKNMILQMDIETSEYQTILSLPPSRLKEHFRFLIFEIHQVQLLANKVGLAALSSFFAKILADFDLVHIHPNNIHPVITHHNFEIPSALEITLARKGTLKYRDAVAHLPHDLDEANVDYQNDVLLNTYWYQK